MGLGRCQRGTVPILCRRLDGIQIPGRLRDEFGTKEKESAAAAPPNMGSAWDLETQTVSGRTVVT